MGRYQQITPSVNIYDEGYSGPLVQAAFGYDRLIFDRFLLGVELFGSFSQAIHAERHYTAATYDWNHSIKTPLAYGLAIKPGYRLNNSDIFYLKPTYQVTQYKRQTEPSTSDTMGPNTQIHVGGVGIGIG